MRLLDVIAPWLVLLGGITVLWTATTESGPSQLGSIVVGIGSAFTLMTRWHQKRS